jgi:AAA family ATP:ADP antiporter
MGATPSRAARAFSRVLGLFARVEPAIVFVLMCGYYLLKTAREPLILLQWGAEAKLYAEAVQAVLLLAVVRGYSALARRVDRMRLLAVVYLFFASHMVVFALLARAGVHVGLAFFLWVGIFSYTTIAQFWAFAADIYTEEQGKRLFAVVCIVVASAWLVVVLGIAQENARRLGAGLHPEWLGEATPS